MRNPQHDQQGKRQKRNHEAVHPDFGRLVLADKERQTTTTGVVKTTTTRIDQ